MKTVGNRVIIIIAVMFFLMSFIPAMAEEKGGTDYFPLSVGSWWKYKVELFETELLVKVTGKEKIGGYDCFVVEFSKAGKVNSVAYYAKTKNRILVIGSLDIETREPKVYKKPRIYLEYPLKPGKSWTFEDDPLRSGKTVTKKVEKEEKVTVPSGEFDCLYVSTKPEEHDTISETWYAPGVGAVKMIMGKKGSKLQVPLIEYQVK